MHPNTVAPPVRAFRCRLLSWVICLVAFAGLAYAPEGWAALKTPTGKPEVTIRTSAKAAIADVIADQMLSNDFMLKSRGENIVVFAKDRSALYGRAVEYRVIFTLIESASGVRVVASMIQYTRANTPAEKLDIDFSRHPKTAPGIQSILEFAKNKIETRAASAAAAPPLSGRDQAIARLEQDVAPDAPAEIVVLGLTIAGRRVTRVAPGGPAERAGLQVGDVIVSIDGQPAGTSVQNGSRLAGRPDTSVLLVLQRGDEQLKRPVARERSAK